jgi:phage shock protein A
MDPITLSAAAVAALSPYLAKAGEKLAESAGEAAWKGASRLYDALKRRVKGTAAEAPLADLEAEPDESDNQADLRKALRRLLADDPTFAAELAALLPDAASDGGATFHTSIQGGVKNLAQGQTVIVHGQN